MSATMPIDGAGLKSTSAIFVNRGFDEVIPDGLDPPRFDGVSCALSLSMGERFKPSHVIRDASKRAEA